MSKTIRTPVSPCYGCTERSPKCHSTCEEYMQFKADFEQTKAQRRAANVIEEYTSAKIEGSLDRRFKKARKRIIKRH